MKDFNGYYQQFHNGSVYYNRYYNEHLDHLGDGGGVSCLPDADGGGCPPDDGGEDGQRHFDCIAHEGPSIEDKVFRVKSLVSVTGGMSHNEEKLVRYRLEHPDKYMEYLEECDARLGDSEEMVVADDGAIKGHAVPSSVR